MTKLISIDLIFIIITIIACIFFSINNIVKRFRFIENKLFIAGCFLAIFMLSIMAYQIVNHDTADLTRLSRYFYGLLLSICQTAFIIMQIYPRWEKKSPLSFVLLSQIPGIVIIIITIVTDLVILDTIYNEAIIESFGVLAPLYGVIYSIYLLTAYLTLVYKSNFLENEAFRIQLFPFLIGLVISAACFVVFFVFFPVSFDIYKYKTIGLMSYGFGTLIVINYALSDERLINFKVFYYRVFIWIIISFILFIPAYWTLEKLINTSLMFISFSPFISSVIISIVIVVLYRVLKPIADKILNRKDRALQDEFNVIYNIISQLSEMRKQKIDWNNFYEKGIDLFCGRLNISKAWFYVFNEETKIFEIQHNYADESLSLEFTEDHSLLQCLNENRQIFDKSIFYTDLSLRKYKVEILNFFKDNNIEVVLPIFTHKDKLIGLFFLGEQTNGKPYSIYFLSLLDNYRIQFSILLENSMLSEEIRETQVVKRDKMVVRNVKKRIFPSRFNGLDGLRVSSLYINNSEFGGDYFDSIKISQDKSGIYISNTPDAGVESALLLVQMSAILRAQAESLESPESLLNTINQVLFSSRFTEKYARAFYMIYSGSRRELQFSNAAYNPMVIYDPGKEKFLEFEAEGIPLGLDKTFHYQYRSTFAPPEGIGFFYSDGVSSAINNDGNNYSINRIKDIISLNKTDSPDVLIRKVYEDFKDFIKDAKLLNDVSLIIFRAS